jgi:hypothetical protein
MTGMKVSWDEARVFAQLVSDHWEDTGRNPSLEEVHTMVEIARLVTGARTAPAAQRDPDDGEVQG